MSRWSRWRPSAPRALTLALALVLGGVGCKGGGGGAGAAEVVPGRRVGVVREVTGTVTATRPGAPARALAFGDAVSGDDVIATGADGAVMIELDHNHVTFTLPAGRTQEVAASLAWRQPVAAAPSATTESSAAAGRAVERSAVDTAASSAEPTAAAAPPTAPIAPPAQSADDEKPKPRSVRPDPPPPPDSPKDIRDEDIRDDEGANTGASGGGAARGVPEAALAPEHPTLGQGAAAAAPALIVEVDGALGHAAAAAALPAELAGCWAAGASARVTVAVTAQGDVGRVSGADAAVARCVRAKLAGVRFPTAAAATTLVLRP